MNTTDHLTRLQTIAQAEIPVKPATEHHRYYWLVNGHLPEPLKQPGVKSPSQRSDYQNACESVKTFWKSDARTSDREFARLCRAMNKRDSLGKIFVHDAIGPVSEYQAATALTPEKLAAVRTLAKDHHLRSNPITEIAQAFVMQKQLMRK